MDMYCSQNTKIVDLDFKSDLKVSNKVVMGRIPLSRSLTLSLTSPLFLMTLTLSYILGFRASSPSTVARELHFY